MADPRALAQIRDFEARHVLERVGPGVRVLELGAGSGQQGARIAGTGATVLCLDLPAARPPERRWHPVVPYDGAALPVRDASVDVVYSSNVLEHVLDLPALLEETRRVLREGGVAIHLMPTSSWRLWTTLGQYARALGLMWSELAKLGRVEPDGTRRTARFTVNRLAALFRYHRRVPPHGETGTGWTELWWFRRARWRGELRRAGFVVTAVRGAGLFYTGEALAGTRIGTGARRALARVLGSSSALYVVRSAAAGEG